MATSRTGTAAHKRMRTIVLAEAQARGVINCPGCRVELDYRDGRAPNGAQADEIVPFARAGETSSDPNDWQVLCAKCNQRKGDRGWIQTDDAPPFPLSREW